MTISTTNTRNAYSGNGATTTFPYAYRILNAADLTVTKRLAGSLVETTLTYPSDYTVSGVGNVTGGSITLTVTPATGDQIVIRREMTRTQPTSIRNQGSYFPETHETVFDRITMFDQEQDTEIARTFRLPSTVDPSAFDMDLPVPIAGQVLAWSSDGLTNSAVSPSSVVLPGEGRTTDTLSTYLANNYVYNVLDYDADPLGGIDATNAIQSAITAAGTNGGGVVTVPRGTYLVMGLAMMSNVILQGMPGATLQKNGGGAGTVAIGLTGSLSATSTTLGSNAAIGQTDLPVTSSTGFNVNDLVLVYDLTYKYATSGRNQEIDRVGSTSAGHVVVKQRLIGNYATASTATVAKVNAIDNAHILGLTVNIPSGTAGGGIYGVLCNDCSVRDVRVIGPSDMPGIRFDQSRGVQLLGGGIRDGQTPTTQGTSYGWIFNEACHNCLARGVFTQNVRENPISNNSRLITVEHCTDEGSTDSSFNTHGTGNENVTYIACRSISPKQYGFGISFSGNQASDQNISLIGCSVYRSGSTAIQVNGDVGKEPKNIRVVGCTADGFGVTNANSCGLIIQNTLGYSVTGGDYSGASIATNTTQGIYLIGSTNGRVVGATVRDVANGFGIQIQSCTTTLVEANQIYNVSSSNIRSVVANTGLVVKNNVSDDTSFAKLAGDRFEGNVWGTKFDDDRGAATTVTDGATIAHNCVATPVLVSVTPTIASQMASVTAVTSTTFTVAIKTDAGAAGTSQTIYWRAVTNV